MPRRQSRAAACDPDAALARIRRQLAHKTRLAGRHARRGAHLLPVFENLLGVRGGESQAAPSERTFRCESCGLHLDRDENAARNLAALAERVAASGAETENARSPTQVSSGTTGRGVDREAGIARLACQTGAAFEQSEAA